MIVTIVIGVILALIALPFALKTLGSQVFWQAITAMALILAFVVVAEAFPPVAAYIVVLFVLGGLWEGVKRFRARASR